MSEKTCVECKHFYYYRNVPACGHYGEVINRNDNACKRFIQKVDDGGDKKISGDEMNGKK